VFFTSAKAIKGGTSSQARRQPRILAILPNIPLWGHERANIEAIRQLRSRGLFGKFLIRKEWTNETIQPLLSKLDIPYEYISCLNEKVEWNGARGWAINLRALVLSPFQMARVVARDGITHIHISSTRTVANIFTFLLLSRLPVIFRAGDAPPLHHPVFRFLWRFTKWRACHFICNSHFVRNTLISLGASPGKCTVIYTPPPLRIYSGPVKRTAKALPLQSLQFVFSYVGQITREKGVDLLIESSLLLLRQGYSFVLVIAGPTYRDRLTEELQQSVANAGFSQNILFIGQIEDISSIYNMTSVHVAPSVWAEPLGGTVIEAKSFGVPSIVFPNGGLIELVENGVDGTVCMEPTAQWLAKAMRAYLERPASAREQGIAAYHSLQARLGVDRYGELLANVYQETLSEP